ncbi:hypothetical protein QJQ45_005513 [Haematococcus lacustris]|nr:hypothetical protein QJQ45_005513 [Haematococcus lacustris]
MISSSAQPKRDLPGERLHERSAVQCQGSGYASAVLKRRANRTGQNPLATDTNAVPDELQEEPQQEQHLRSAAFLPWQERRERSDAATRSNSEQRKREYVRRSISRSAWQLK